MNIPVESGKRQNARGRVLSGEQSRNTLEVIQEKFRNYCETSTLSSLSWLVAPNRPWIERIICIVIHVTTFYVLGLVAVEAYREYQRASVVISIDSTSYPTNKLPFPGVSICSVNRISRKAAIELAKEIFESNRTNLNYDEIFELIREVGSLYESEGFGNVTAEKRLHQLFIEYYNGEYDVTEILKKLSPTCEETLSFCGFRGLKGENEVCSQLFTTRRTLDGFCCVFNYVPRVLEKKDVGKSATSPQPYYIDEIGLQGSLSILLYPLENDYFYPILPLVGWKLMIFKPHEFPSNIYGSVAEILVSKASLNIIASDVSSSYSTSTVKSMTVGKRQCIFEGESAGFKGLYTEGDCRLRCYAADIWDACKCRPFYFPAREDDKVPQRICNMDDLECLRRRSYAQSMISEDYETEANGESRTVKKNKKSRSCAECYATCNDFRYSHNIFTTHLEPGAYNMPMIQREVGALNESMILLYFKSFGSLRNKQTVAYDWYDFVSNIGGLCGLFVGISLVSAVEFVYFILSLLSEFLPNANEDAASNTRTATAEADTGNRYVTTLYWNEIHSISRRTEFQGNWMKSLE